MSQSDYIHFKRNTTNAGTVNSISSLPNQTDYLNNKLYYLENTITDENPTYNQLTQTGVNRVFSMDIKPNKKCVSNITGVVCSPKTIYGKLRLPVVVNRSVPTLQLPQKHMDCIFVDDNLYCNGNKNIKPITYINNIHYNKYNRPVQPNPQKKHTFRLGMGKMFQMK